MVSNDRVERPRDNACRAVEQLESQNLIVVRLALYPSRSAPMMGWTPPDLYRHHCASWPHVVWVSALTKPEGVLS